MGFASIVRRQRGVVALSAANTYVGKGKVRWRVESGRWQRPWPGVIVTHSGPLSAEQRHWVRLLSAGRGAVLAGLTAAMCDGLRGFEVGVTYVVVPSGRQVAKSPGLVVHRSSFLEPEDVHPARLPPRTRLARSVVDAAGWAPTDRRARAIVVATVQQRLLRPADLLAVTARLRAAPWRGLIRETLGEARRGSGSVWEVDFIRLVRRFGLPEPTRQAVRLDEHGRPRWVDAYFEEWGVVVEIDGLWHMEVETWWADMMRDNAITIGGDRLLRFPGFAIRAHEETVAGQIAAALRRAGWTGTLRTG